MTKNSFKSRLVDYKFWRRSCEERDSLFRAIRQAKKEVDSWPAWKRGISETSKI